MPSTVVVVGASVGGIRTAQALRSEGHGGPIVVIGAEPDLPYDKPPLSKQFLAGSWDEDRLALLTPEQAADAGIELRLGVPAEHLDVAGTAVVLADGERVGYDSVVLATGAAARPSPWQPGSGVHVIRTLADSRQLRQALAEHAGPVVIVGGGFIGAEVAATVHAAGRTVTVVDPQPAPIGRVLGPEIGLLFGSVHERNGVQTRFGIGVQDVTGHAGDLKVTLTSGEILPAATVVVGIGATPNVDWLASSGLLIENGVVCDEFCRALDRPDVYAAGDVARWMHLGHQEPLRVEHWTNAAEQAGCVAHNLVHPDELRPYTPQEYVWSDQYDWKIQIVGRPHAGTSHQIIGDVQGLPTRFAVLYRDSDERFVGAATVNWPKALMLSRRGLSAGSGFEDVRALVDALPGASPAVR